MATSKLTHVVQFLHLPEQFLKLINNRELFSFVHGNFMENFKRETLYGYPSGVEIGLLHHVWSRYFGTNRIIDNWHRCLGVMWRKRKNISINHSKNFLWTVNFYFFDRQNYLHIMGNFLNCLKMKLWMKLKHHKKIFCNKRSSCLIFPNTHSCSF